MNKNPFLKDVLKHITIVEQVGDDVVGRSEDGKHRVRLSNAKLTSEAIVHEEGYEIWPFRINNAT